MESRLIATRDKALVCLAGLAPDLDGLGIVVDFVTRLSGSPETNYYQDFHRLVGHGLPAALVISGVAASLGLARMRVAFFAFIAMHLHFLCDLIGSRGTTAEDIWPIYYLEPFFSVPVLSLPFQWPLVGWQNMALSAALMYMAFARATITGYSPLVIFSRTADPEFVVVLRKWKRVLVGLVRSP